MSRILPPATHPCGSCPYRRDVPSGVWAEEEYRKLPDFDGPTHAQPPSVFLCHQQDGRLCAGWTACHDMEESLGLRMAVGLGQMDAAHVAEARRYATSTPLFSSGAEACAHGMREVEVPGERAMKTVNKLHQRRKESDGSPEDRGD